MNLRNKLAFFIALNSYVELITRGTSPLSLPDAVANSLSYVKAFGGTEQNGTPTPDAPMDIVSNNGVVKVTTKFDITRLYTTGNPSVSNEGIYTTNSSQSYVRTQNSINFSTANSWSFKWKFVYKRANTDQGIMSGDGNQNVQAIINSVGRPRFSFGNGNDWQVFWNDSSLAFAYQEGVSYDNEIYFDGTRYGFKVNGIEIGGVDSTARAANTYFALGVERQRTSTQYTRCTWDLSETSLVVDGVEQLPWIVRAITTDGEVETIADSANHTATVATLLGVGDYRDTQNINTGAITRRVGVKVLDGTEDWTYNNSAFLMDLIGRLPQKHFMFCTHFNYDSGSSTAIPNLSIGGGGTANTIFIKYQTYNTVAQFKQWLADQYAAGTPVIIVYPLATATTESVAGQTLQVQAGDNTLEITQASLNGLKLEAKYKKRK